MGIKQEDFNYISDKAKNKRDGIWQARNITYATKNKRLIFIANYGDLYQVSHGFLVFLCKYNTGVCDSFINRKKQLIKLLKQEATKDNG